MKNDLQLQSFHQSYTYAGLILGVPSEENNEQIVADALREAKEMSGRGPDPVLIPPKITMRKVGPNGEKVPFLPLLECIGVLSNGEPFKAKTQTVVWFQDGDLEIGVPTGIRKCLRSSLWNSEAYKAVLKDEAAKKREVQRKASKAVARERAIASALPKIRALAIKQGLATEKNVNRTLYNLSVEKFKELTRKWPNVSRVHFK